MNKDRSEDARQLTELDFVRLTRLIAAHPAPALTQVLSEADVVPGPQVDADVVTMYTQFELRDDDTQDCRVIALCYPEDAEPSSGFVSVLSPLGCSLIGLREGARAQWRTPAGEKAAEVTAVLFQPEASGDYRT